MAALSPRIGYNLSSDDGGGFLTGPGDQIDTEPLLGPLRNNGGPTFTHSLLRGSLAIDAGDPNFTPPPFYDQRGPEFSASSTVASISVHLSSNRARARPRIRARLRLNSRSRDSWQACRTTGVGRWPF